SLFRLDAHTGWRDLWHDQCRGVALLWSGQSTHTAVANQLHGLPQSHMARFRHAQGEPLLVPAWARTLRRCRQVRAELGLVQRRRPAIRRQQWHHQRGPHCPVGALTKRGSHGNVDQPLEFATSTPEDYGTPPTLTMTRSALVL